MSALPVYGGPVDLPVGSGHTGKHDYSRLLSGRTNAVRPAWLRPETRLGREERERYETGLRHLLTTVVRFAVK